MKKTILYYSLTLLLVVLQCACSDDTEGLWRPPVVLADEATEITRYTAVLHGSIQNPEGRSVKGCGFLYSTSRTMADAVTLPLDEAVSDGSFSQALDGLESGKQYYYCSYAFSGSVTERSEVLSFTTALIEGPTFSEVTADREGVTGLQLRARLLDNGGNPLSLVGFLYKEVTDDDLSLQIGLPGVVFSSASAATDSFSVALSDLRPGHTYVVCAAGVSSDIFGYSPSLLVDIPATTLPALSSVSFSGASINSFQASARVLNSGTSEVIEKGFCYSREHTEPTLADLSVRDESAGTNIECTLSDIRANETYYVRAYARNSQGCEYGPVATYTNERGIIVETFPADSIIQIRALLHGAITFNNMGEVKSRGFCWSDVNDRPTVSGNNCVVTGSENSYSYWLEWLRPDTKYYYRAFVEYGTTIIYGSVHSFTTLPIVLASVSTVAAADVTTSEARLFGRIDHNGYGTILRSGFCYGTHPDLLLENSYQAPATEGNMEVRLSALDSDCTYYYRAFAENEAGVSYGEVRSFTTLRRTPSSGDIDYPTHD